ncbi:hypothetical protein D3C79_1009360 [compost metagenome]
MGTLFNQADFNVGQQLAQRFGRLGGHQRIAAGEQVQLRAAIRLQRFAGIQLSQHLKPGGQVQWVGVRYPYA